MTEQEILDAIYEHILAGDAEAGCQQVGAGIERGVAPDELLFEAMIPALEEVGRLFEEGEYFLPEMLVSARAMRAAMEVLRPHLAGVAAGPAGTFVIGTVAGDIHDIGKNLCCVMLEGAGFEVIDLGIDVSAEEFVAAIRRHRPDIVGMSAFLSTTVHEIERNLAVFGEAGVRDSVKVIVGGAPVTEEYAADVGADGYAPDAGSATRLAKALLDAAR